jgi:hypothetical protein
MKRICLEELTVGFILICTGVPRAEAWTKSEYLSGGQSVEQ